MKTENPVVDIKKLTDEEIGKLYRKTGEIILRVNDGTISFEDSLEAMQKIVVEGKSAQYLDVFKGIAEITYPEHLINCDSKPFTPDGWKIEEHKKCGLLKFSPVNIFFYLSKKQKKESISGHDLRKELADKSVMNANVLDYLLAHPELILESWKGKIIFFWGTIYRNAYGYLHVRYLFWRGSGWGWEYRWLDRDFNSDNPAALAK